MTYVSFLTLEGAEAEPALFIRTTSCFKADVHKQLTPFTAGLLSTVHALIHNRTDLQASRHFYLTALHKTCPGPGTTVSVCR